MLCATLESKLKLLVVQTEQNKMKMIEMMERDEKKKKEKTNGKD